MRVSICCITYNHSAFVLQALESFLEQKTSFDIEIVVSDDSSIDHTAAIVEKLQNKHPEKIKLYRHTQNLGMMSNFKFALEACTGKYIAVCEGDDYWTDPGKLQKQVDFLEANPGYALSFHAVYEQEGNRRALSQHNISAAAETKTIADLARYNFIATPSVVFRNGLIGLFPSWFETSPVGDYVVHMLNARKGKIRYFPETMAVYRKHGGSTWSGTGQKKMSERWVMVLDLLLQEDFPDDVVRELKSQRRYTLNTILKLTLDEGNEALFRQKMSEYAEIDPLIREEWLTIYYPAYIKELKSGGAYRLAQKLISIKNIARR